MEKQVFRHIALGLLTSLSATFISPSAVQASRVGVYCFMANGTNVTAYDGNVCTRLVLTDDGAALIEVENETDSILYVNRGNSFAYVNGEVAPMFIPSAETESQTVMTGITDRSWQGISYMNGLARTSSQTVFDRRILPVAPHSRSTVYVWRELPGLLRKEVVETHYAGQGVQCRKGRFLTFSDEHDYSGKGAGYGLGKTFFKGDSRHYDADSTPLSLGANLQYGFDDPLQGRAMMPQTTDDSGQRLRHAVVSDYVSTIIIGSHEGIDKNGRLTCAPPQAPDLPCFAFRNGRNASMAIATAGSVAALVGLVAIIGNQDIEPMPSFPY